VGGGAGDLKLATRLCDRVRNNKRATVTLVERNRTHLWKPLLHAVAAGSLDRAQQELNYLAQAHSHHFTYRFGKMVDLDRDAKQVLLGAMFDDGGARNHPRQLGGI